MTASIDNQSRIQQAQNRVSALLIQDPEVGRSRPWPEAIEELSKLNHSIEIIARASELYGPRPALGFRDFEMIKDSRSQRRVRCYLPQFKTLSFSVMWDRVLALASGLQASVGLKSEDSIGMIGFASVDYVIVDLASLYLCVTSIPLQATYSSEELLLITNEASLTSLVCSFEQLETVSNLIPRCPSIQSLLVMDFCEQDENHQRVFSQVKQKLHASRAQLQVSILQEIEEQGKKIGAVPWVIPKSADTLMSICYTSGSTGSPKGALFPESLWTRSFKASWLPEDVPAFPYITVNYAPLNHMMGRLGVMSGIFQGGVTYFTLKSDLSSLFDDIRLVRPTTLALVPRLSEMIYQVYQTEVLRREQSLASDSDLTQSDLTQSDLTQSDLTQKVGLKKEVMGEMRDVFLGNRIIAITVGSAPTSPDVLNFLRECFNIPVFESYGLTECGSVTVENRINRKTIIDYQLRDVPELGYRSSDSPFPRGELTVKSLQSIPGYFNNPEATKRLFDEKGYLRTGDIVEERGPDTLIWIDRSNNVIKLSQGEFVTLWRLESIFGSGSPFILQIYLYGNSQREYLVAVVVPNRESIISHFAQEKLQVNPIAIQQFLRSEIERIGQESHLRPFEIPREFVLEEIAFSQNNGLLTGINKLARRKLKEKYGERLEQLYSDLEKRKIEGAAELTQMGVESSVREKLKKMLQATLGLSTIDLSLSQNFKSLGGDSLRAVQLSDQIQQVLHLSLPVGTLLNPTASLEDIVQQLEQELRGPRTSDAVTFQTIHGSDSKEIRAADLQLNRFLSSKELKDAATLKPLSGPMESKATLLTGANGFLGRFLCLELLTHAKKTNGKAYCIIRAKNNDAAFERLCSVYRSDPVLEKHFTQLAETRLFALAGDLSQARLGLTDDTYGRLAHDVDMIVHAGALVNHTLAYPQLFEPNVRGTVEIVRLALKHKPKRLNYISTLGVLNPSSLKKIALEDDDIRLHFPTRALGAGYASGYSASKWASEVLLHNFFEQFKIPVNIFRCDMIMAASHFIGQINVPDLFTRLLFSVISTGIAPKSFYQADKYAQDGKVVTPHFDGLPVEFIASSIISICIDSLKRSQKCSIYHVSNCHWEDKVSLNKIIDWVQSGGYSIERLPDYQQWYFRMAEKLRALNPRQRQYSSHSILHQWERQLPVLDGYFIDSARFQQKVRELCPEGLTDIPQLNEEFMHKCIRDLQALGILTTPERMEESGKKAS